MHNINFDKLWSGDFNESKMYLGSYNLIKCGKTGELFRTKEDYIPGYVTIIGVHDDDGFLDSKYWSLPRIDINDKRY